MSGLTKTESQLLSSHLHEVLSEGSCPDEDSFFRVRLCGLPRADCVCDNSVFPFHLKSKGPVCIFHWSLEYII